MIEALVTGRAGLDLYPEQYEVPLEDVKTFRQYAGGFAVNVATGLARLGVRTAIHSSVGNDGHGRHIRRFLEHEGVDCAWLGTDPTLPTALAFCEIWPPDDFPITYHRTPTCPDWEVSPEDVELDFKVASQVPLLYVSATALARTTSREAMVALAQARLDGPGHTILDLDWRSMLWPSAAEYAARVHQIVPLATSILGGDREWAAASLDPDATSSAIRVAKHGRAGCTVYLPDGSELRRPGCAVTTVNGLGAGDAFAAGWGFALLRELDDPGRIANAAGAIVASRHSCAMAMPRPEELRALMATGNVPGAQGAAV
ncbi:MAG: 5-dehydro-2-deoxygluconokinase [Gemmatimonadaceae bacterium]